MSRRHHLLLLVVSFTLGANHPVRGEQLVREAKQKPVDAKQVLRTDLYGDPLPEGALARFGTIYLKSNFSTLLFDDRRVAFRDDGSEFYSWKLDGLLRVHDTATGKVIRAYRLPSPFWTSGKVLRLRWSAAEDKGAQFSTNGHLLTLPIPDDSAATAKALTVWDTTTGKLVRRIDAVAGESFWCWDVSVRGGGTVVTCDLEPGAVRVWNLQNGTHRVLRKTSAQIGSLNASVDGKRLFVQLEKSIECWDMADGKRIWENRSGGSVRTVAPDGRALLVHAGAGARLQLLDPATGEAQAKLKPPPWRGDGRSKWGSDSKTLLTSDADGVSLVVWDLVAGKERDRFPEFHESVMAPDGESIVVAGEGLQLWNLETKKPLYPSTADRGHTQSLEDLVCSPDGKVIVSADQNGTLCFWNLPTSRLIRVVRKMNGASLAFTADGKTLLVGTSDKTLLVCDPASGKVLRRWKLNGLPEDNPGIGEMTVRDRNTVVINQCNPLAFSLKAVHAVPPPGGATGEWDIETGNRRWLRSVEGEKAFLALSPDGRLGVDWLMNLREAKSGWLLGPLGEKDERVPVLPSGIFSLDGSFIATTAYRLPSGAKSTEDSTYMGVEVWEAATRRLLRRLPLHLSGQFAFAPDGRRLAILRAEELWVWDVVRGKELLHLQAPASAAYWRGTRLAFVPNGRALAMATEDGSILLWEIPAAAPAALPVLGEAQIRRTWETLADADPAKAFTAAADLADRPSQGVAFLKDRLKPAAPIPPEQVRSLVAALDADAFNARETTERKLAALGPQAWPALRKALGTRPSPEAKRRLERLLEAEKRPPSSDMLRSQRALRVLEWAGSAEARELLKKLAAGDPDASLTQDAKAALRRLEQVRKE